MPAAVRVQHRLQANQQQLADRTLPVTATIVEHCSAPFLVVAPSSLNFGIVEAGMSRAMGFQLRNEGDAPLTVSALN